MSQLTRSKVFRLCAAVTLLLLLLALFLPTRQVGNTAVIGEAFLWGERTLQNAPGTGRPFADKWEAVQHALFIWTMAVTVWTLYRGRALWLGATSFGCLVWLDAKRCFESEGAAWVAMTYRLFWFFGGWAVVILSVALLAALVKLALALVPRPAR
jgi:hypothetical protein